MAIDGGVLMAGLIAAGSLLVLVLLLTRVGRDPVERRVSELSAEPKSTEAGSQQSGVAPSRFATVTLAPSNLERQANRRLQKQDKKHDMEERMLQAGLYSPGAAHAFFVVRMLLMGVPPALGFLLGGMIGLSPARGLWFGLIAGLAGTIAPGFILDRIKRSRQTKIRRALPDALDITAVCLQGGLSLPGALSRVANELAIAHPLLAMELNIVERHIQMGQSSGEAIREMANRLDLEELRSMASALVQAERVGASIASALAVFADTLRMKRHQRAEQMAHEASVKMLIPTLLFIFPAIFIVVLGPAAIQVYEQLVQGVMRGTGS
jgi:tight adherence protein C